MTDLRAPTPTVLQIGQLGFEGHIIPRTWYQTITHTTAGGKTRADILAINILSEIIYWYRPKTVVDEVTGKTIGVYRKFSSDKLQRSYQALADYFGITKRQAADACKRLRDAGLITLELRTFVTKTGVKMVNVLYIEPIPEAVRTMTFPPEPIQTEIPETSYEKTEEVLQEKAGDSTKKERTNTDISPETSTKISILPSAKPTPAVVIQASLANSGASSEWKGSPPPAAHTFRAETQRWPPKTWYADLHQAIGEQEDDLQFWRDVVHQYVGLGWNPTNVAGMLEWYERRELPALKKDNGGSRPDHNAAVLERARQRIEQERETIEMERSGQVWQAQVSL